MTRMFLAGFVWNAICLKVAFADPQCVDGKERAGLKSSSLMQLSKGKMSTDALDTSSDSLAGFSQMVEDLAEKVAGHNYTLGKSESDALEIIRKWILNMNNTLTLQHKEDQAEVNGVRDMIQGCTDSTTKLLSSNVSAYKQTTDSDRSAHTACRNRQCASGDLENAACIDYDRYRKGQKPYLNGDEVPPSCLNSLDEAKIETSDPDTRESMEMCLEKTHTWLLPLHSRYLLCDRRKANHTNITHKCNQLQKKFEASFCAYELKLSDTCEYHKTCRDKELGVRTTTHAEVRISEAARKADHITGKKVLCLFDVFLADNPNKTQTLNRCRALQVDTSPFDIVYPDPPAPAPCVKEPNKPCDDAWKTKEYGKLCVGVNTCTACPKPQLPVKEMGDDCSGWSVNTHHIIDNKCYMGAFDQTNRRITKTFSGLQAGCTYKWKAVIDTWSSVDNEKMILSVNGDGTTFQTRGSGGCSNGWTQYAMKFGTKAGCSASNHGWKDCWKNFEKDFVVPDSGNADIDMYFEIDQAMSDECWGWHDMTFTRVSCPGQATGTATSTEVVVPESSYYPRRDGFPEFPRVVGQGTWYGNPREKITGGSCNGNYAFTAYNMLYNCNNGGYGTCWAGADCRHDTNCPDRLWFTMDLGRVKQVNSIAIKPRCPTDTYRSSHYELLTSTDTPGPKGPNTGESFSVTSSGFTRVAENNVGDATNQEYTHVVNAQARFIMFHAIGWNNGRDNLRSAGVEYLRIDAA